MMLKKFNIFANENHLEIDPLGEEDWGDDFEDLTGKVFYYIRYFNINAPQVLKLYCMNFSKYYFEFSENKNRRTSVITINQKNIHIINNEEDIRNHIEYLIPEEKYDIFLKTYRFVFRRFKQANIDKMQADIENIQNNISRIEKLDADKFLTDYMKKRGVDAPPDYDLMDD